MCNSDWVLWPLKWISKMAAAAISDFVASEIWPRRKSRLTDECVIIVIKYCTSARGRLYSRSICCHAPLVCFRRALITVIRGLKCRERLSVPKTEDAANENRHCVKYQCVVSWWSHQSFAASTSTWCIDAVRTSSVAGLRLAAVALQYNPTMQPMN